MKKTKFLVGALVLSMGLAGTGYALWSDTLEVSSTVKTGNFDVQFVKEPTVFYKYDNDQTWNTVKDKYINIEATGKVVPQNTVQTKWEANDKLNINVEDMVPGSSVRVNVEIENLGDVAAILDSLTAIATGDDELLKAMKLGVNVYDRIADNNPDGFKDVPILENDWINLIDLKDEKTSLKIKENLTYEDGVLFVSQQQGVDNDLTLCIDLVMPEGKKGDNTTQNQQVGVALEFDFVQHLKPASN